jgi:hypothetical protein
VEKDNLSTGLCGGDQQQVMSTPSPCAPGLRRAARLTTAGAEVGEDQGATDETVAWSGRQIHGMDDRRGRGSCPPGISSLGGGERSTERMATEEAGPGANGAATWRAAPSTGSADAICYCCMLMTRRRTNDLKMALDRSDDEQDGGHRRRSRAIPLATTTTEKEKNVAAPGRSLLPGAAAAEA